MRTRTLNRTTARSVRLGLLLLAVTASLSCEERTDRTDGGGVLLSVSTFQFGNITIPISVNETGLFVQAESITLRSVVKDPTGVTSPLMDVEMESYQVIYRRVDRGTVTPPPYVQRIFGTVPVGGTDQRSNFNLLGPDQLRNRPLSDLLFVNGGIDRETGSQIVSLELEITFFGRTLSGDSVASEPVALRLDFSP
jgi:hypothetical protein